MAQFPDKAAAAWDIYRVLCDGGQTVITTGRPVVECQFFGTVCKALRAVGEPEIADLMGVPFDDGPKLKKLPKDRLDQFRKTFVGLLKELSSDGITMGRMVSNVLSAEKPMRRT